MKRNAIIDGSYRSEHSVEVEIKFIEDSEHIKLPSIRYQTNYARNQI